MMKRCGWMCMMKKCGCTWREGMDAHNEKVGMYVMRWGCMWWKGRDAHKERHGYMWRGADAQCVNEQVFMLNPEADRRGIRCKKHAIRDVRCIKKVVGHARVLVKCGAHWWICQGHCREQAADEGSGIESKEGGVVVSWYSPKEPEPIFLPSLYFPPTCRSNLCCCELSAIDSLRGNWMKSNTWVKIPRRSARRKDPGFSSG